MTASIRPIFLFSLPRSGSTLLQRILAAHSAIGTASEPWLLLPLLESREDRARWNSDGFEQYLKARDDFCAVLPNGRNDYRGAVGRFVRDLYAQASRPSSQYFLDKTPRYHRIAREIADTFPDGKFIFLWRQPLAIAASMMQTWSAGKWNLYRFEQDLGGGLNRLIGLYRDLGREAIAIKYEDLVGNADVEIGRVLDYLGLQHEAGMLTSFVDVHLHGGFGDPTGIRLYSSVSQEPLDKWQDAFGNPLRKYWARRYIESICERDIATLGYSRKQILAELDAVRLSWRYFASDLVRMSSGRYWSLLGSVRRCH